MLCKILNNLFSGLSNSEYITSNEAYYILEKSNLPQSVINEIVKVILLL